jgi:hypothetical protein
MGEKRRLETVDAVNWAIFAGWLLALYLAGTPLHKSEGLLEALWGWMSILMILTYITGAESVDVKYRKQSDQVRELQFKIDRLEKELGGSKE